jgi:hypothetical protein
MSILCPLSSWHPNGHQPIFSFEMSNLCPLSPQYPNGYGPIPSFEMSILCLLSPQHPDGHGCEVSNLGQLSPVFVFRAGELGQNVALLWGRERQKP